MFEIKLFFLKEKIRTIRHFYKKPRFAFLDLFFSLIGLFSNPYRVCRKFLQKKGEAAIYAYGETPFMTLQTIANECCLQQGDTYLELGSGRGALCFWVSQFIGCKVVGIEWVPSFRRLSSFLKWLFRVKNVQFIEGDFTSAEVKNITFVYLYGTCLEAKRIEILTEMLEKLPQNGKVVTISYPLKSRHFTLEKIFPVRFPWGDTEAYLQIKSGLKKYPESI